MASKFPVNRFDLRRYVPPQYFWPVLLLLLICFGCVFLLLYVSTRSQDTNQHQREEQALTSAFRNAAEMVQHDLQDYGKWDDAVRNTQGVISNDWVEDNIVAYLGRTQGYSQILILDGLNQPIYSFGRTDGQTDRVSEVLGRTAQDKLRILRNIPTQNGPIISGYSRVNDTIFIYSAAAIVPLTNKVELPPGPTKILMIAREVDPAFLRKTTDELHLQDVRLQMEAGSPDTIELHGVDGAPVARVAWTPQNPGTDLLRQLAPWLGLLVLFAVSTAALIVRHGGRAVEALKQSELRTRHHAFHDLLTGLPNRRALVDEISDRLAAGAQINLLYMDLDGFKDANDVYGHPAGDLLLKEASQRIQLAAPNSLVARAGGDEFAVLLLGTTTSKATEICELILKSFRSPFEIGAYRVTLGISIGCARNIEIRKDGQDELMRRADVAMYAAKSEGKNRSCHYTPALDEGHIMRMRLERDLQEAVETGTILAHYQPIVDAHSHNIVAYEALARWSHPNHGNVPPDVFIPIAEMNGLISAIGRQVLLQACSAMRDRGADLAVNLSPAQFWDRNLVQDVQEVLRVTGFPPNRLELEITESLLIRRPEKAAEVIERLHLLGIKIALDDFGTGFASIGYLQRLKFDRIKIDKAFIAPLESDPKSREMLLSIVTLARAFDVEVCAEGVETLRQAEVARVAGCARLQGWLFGRPMSLSESDHGKSGGDHPHHAVR